MGEYTLRMPDVGEGVVEAEIVAWHVKPGDRVEEDDDLCDVMTDKATVEIPSPVSGIVKTLTGEPGDVIAVGTGIIVIDTEGDAPADADEEVTPVVAAGETVEAAAAPELSRQESPLPQTHETRAAAAPPPARSPASGQRPLASPAVRQRALDSDVDLSAVPGSGPAGRITHRDLDDFIAAGGRILSAPAAAPAASGPRSVPRAGVTEEKIIGLRRRIADNMARTWSTVPHITLVEEIDVTEVERLRGSLNAERGARAKLTLLPFIGTALCRAVQQVPETNAHYDTESGVLTKYDGVHLGMATATERGLVVPVLKHAEAMDIWQMAADIARLAAAARDGKAAREELSGSTITITSLGALGGITTTPILNAPETAIIGVGKMQERPAFDATGRVVARLFVNLSCSFDHRIVDGYEAALLVRALKTGLEQPARLFM